MRERTEQAHSRMRRNWLSNIAKAISLPYNDPGGHGHVWVYWKRRLHWQQRHKKPWFSNCGLRSHYSCIAKTKLSIFKQVAEPSPAQFKEPLCTVLIKKEKWMKLDVSRNNPFQNISRRCVGKTETPVLLDKQNCQVPICTPSAKHLFPIFGPSTCFWPNRACSMLWNANILGAIRNFVISVIQMPSTHREIPWIYINRIIHGNSKISHGWIPIMWDLCINPIYVAVPIITGMQDFSLWKWQQVTLTSSQLTYLQYLKPT